MNATCHNNKALSYNQQTNKKEYKAVTALHNYIVSTILAMVFTMGDTLWATPNHPFWFKEAYVEASTLKVGDTLHTQDGTYKIIQEIITYDKPERVYNLTVADNNNYVVAAEGILVHNTCFLARVSDSPGLISKIDALPEELKAVFIKDFYNAGDEVVGLFKKNPEWVRAWEILENASRYTLKLDPNILAKVSKVIDNPKLDNFLPNHTPTRNINTREEMVKQIVNLQGEASTIVGNRMSAMGDLMDDVDHFLENFEKVPGSNNFIRELTESGGKMAGGSFVLKSIKNHPDELGTIIRFEVTIQNSADDLGDIVVDLITNKGSVSNIFNEFKNWKTISPNRYSSFAKQFSRYIASKNIGEFFYNFKKGIGNNGFEDISSLKTDVISAISSTAGRTELSKIPLSRIKEVLNNDFINEAGKVQALIDNLDDLDNFGDIFKLLD